MKLVEFSNNIVDQKCNYFRKTSQSVGALDPCDPSLILHDLPEFTTTYTSGSFIVSKENIQMLPREYYQQLMNQLYEAQNSNVCGKLEYMWTTLWGGIPLQETPDDFRICGPLYYCDIESNSGFLFYKSDNGVVEEGGLPEGYWGYSLSPKSKRLPAYNGFRHHVEVKEEHQESKEEL
jgi:hypothetical protein